MKSINSTTARNQFGKIVEQAHHQKKTVIIKRRGHPLAAILPLSSTEPPQNSYGPLSITLFRGGKTKSHLSRREIYGKQGR